MRGRRWVVWGQSVLTQVWRSGRGNQDQVRYSCHDCWYSEMKSVDAWVLQRKRSGSSWPSCWSRWRTHWRRLLIMSTIPPSTLPRGQSCHCHGCPVCGNIFVLWRSQANLCAWNSWDKHSAEIPQCLDGLPADYHFLSWPTAGLTWKDFFHFWIELFVKGVKKRRKRVE